MRRLLSLILAYLLVAVFTGDVLAGSRGGSVDVKGYFRKDGTYVQPHTRTAPDGNPLNNYSFPGNYNPNTGNITPGNPDTYLENYYRKRGQAPGYIGVPSLNTPSTAVGTATPRPLVGPSPEVAPHMRGSSGNVGASPGGPVSLDPLPSPMSTGPRSLDR